jgi:hypothetical protein
MTPRLIMPSARAAAKRAQPATPAPAVEKAKPKPVTAKSVVQRKVVNGSGRGGAVAKVAEPSADWQEF